LTLALASREERASAKPPVACEFARREETAAWRSPFVERVGMVSETPASRYGFPAGAAVAAAMSKPKVAKFFMLKGMDVKRMEVVNGWLKGM
jgi:hypothetical protein